ncbi:MAG: tRNA (N6-isopentenyl adenosine(37)-C2)-methylthiotransferase MiaB [Deltaproteobacteria bacterium]|nr:tRNA (N6-isopentenyl adenosine(37)-C2)-methylthiotransferase MiaB [Deltaproteobacteria bacterium]
MAELTPAPDGKRVFIQTFGCQMNELDSGKMLRLLESDGYAAAADPSDADVILINTCSVREKPEQKVRSLLGRYKKLKHANEDLVIGVTGCYAQQAKGELLRRFDDLDLVMGPDAIPRLPALLMDVRAGRRELATEQLDRQDYPFTNDLVFRGDRRVSAFVTIQKGCDNLCSFCIVPFTRGREVSRSADDVIDEVRRLAAEGVREVTFLGQNVNSYGLKKSNEIPFHELLARAAGVEGIARVRFTTSNPWDLDEGLVALYANEPRLSSYFHLPVQAGADSMLVRMRRRHTRERYLELVEELRAARPDLALSTDIIVGFPGETEEEHQATLSLLSAVRYDFIYSFKYSPRPFTGAVRKYDDDVPVDVKKRRLREVQDLQRTITDEALASWVGKDVEVLVEGPSKRDSSWLAGRIGQNWMVNFKGSERLCGELVTVRVTEALTNSLAGEVVTRASVARSALPILG